MHFAVALLAALFWTGWHRFSGVLGLTGRSRALPAAGRAALCLSVVASAALVVHQWHAIPPRPPLKPSPPADFELTISTVIRPGDPFTTAGIDPTQLFADDTGRLAAAGPGWGLYLGIVAMILLSAALLLAPRSPGERPSGR
jgi:hypothetical protein